MTKKKYLVTLSAEEQQQLEDLTRKGKAKAREFKRALILLKAHEGLSDPQIMTALNVSRPCVERYNYEYQRHGVRNLHMFFEPLVAQRQVRLTERHTMQDFAHQNDRPLVHNTPPCGFFSYIQA